MECSREALQNLWAHAFAIFLTFAATHLSIAGEKHAAVTPQPAAVATNQRPEVIESFRHDASLADVYFTDSTTGWAVGDRGVIWHTQDGGAAWRRQTSGVSCRLNSVFFINAQRGWAVGGEYQHYSSTSRGIVLRTDDGGTTWTPFQRLLMPQLMRVKFFDERRGFAVGEAASTQPSGVFVTQDGGDSWQPVPTGGLGGWLASDFLDDESGAVAGSSGRFGTFARRQIVHPLSNVASLRSFRAMRLTAPTGGWLVGDGGLVLTTQDLGHSWQSPPGELPDFATEHFDFRAVAVFDQQVWVAGSPGTLIFHSPNGGRSWQTIPTGQSAPLRGLTFVDANRGWAVGDLGNILATSDGGLSWRSQLSGGRGVALLGIFAGASDVPLEMFASSGAADGYLAAVDILHAMSADSETAGDSAASERTREALLLAGACTTNVAWRFPLPPAELAHSPADLLDNLNRASDGRAVEQIERHFVRLIRMWQPEIIVTHHTKLDICGPHAAILAALLTQSIDAAADATQHATLTTDVGLAPWQVKKVYGLLPPGSQGAEAMATNQFSPRLGVTFANFVTPARQLIDPANAPPAQYDLEVLASTVKVTHGPRGIFNGITLAAGSDKRRPQPDLPLDQLEELRLTAERRRHLEALLKRTEGDAAWVAQVGQITEGLKADDGAGLLIQLANGYRAAGRLDLAADTYYTLARRYPDHALAGRSLEWLIQFYASSEASHRLDSRGSLDVRQAGLELTQPIEAANGVADSVQQTAAIAPADRSPTIGLSRDNRLQRATQLAEYLRSARPELYAEPRVRFAEVAALRQLGLSNPAKRYYLRLRQLPETNPWRRCSETELWLSKPADLPPTKALGACRPTTERPKLDADLNEPLWATADRLQLHAADDVGRKNPSVSAGNATDKSLAADHGEVRFTYDRDYLYLAIRCLKIPGVEYTVSDRPRPRDADLTQNDRVALRFDIDRDFTTAFELTIDSRGWTREVCWGDVHWNPRWYVAAASDDKSWTVEAAVPLTELVDDPPGSRHVWALSACRTVPRNGYQSWTGEPAADSPDQFGLLIFE